MFVLKKKTPKTPKTFFVLIQHYQFRDHWKKE